LTLIGGRLLGRPQGSLKEHTGRLSEHCRQAGYRHASR